MANTTNFGWETPDDTDLVKDGALAMRTLGNAIDSSLVDLKGGTTGQILSKNSNTDLDYTWINNDQGDITEVQAGTGISVASGTGPVPIVTNTVATTFDAKGDLVVGTGADTFAKLTVGANGSTLVADSSTSTGLNWAAAAGGFNYSSATVTTEQTTTSTSFTDLATSGPSVTVTTGTTAIVILKGIVDNEASGRAAAMGYAVSGASSVSAATSSALAHRNDGARSSIQASVVIPVTGLTAGSNTFTAKYISTLGGTVSFSNRQIIVIY